MKIMFSTHDLLNIMNNYTLSYDIQVYNVDTSTLHRFSKEVLIQESYNDFMDDEDDMIENHVMTDEEFLSDYEHDTWYCYNDDDWYEEYVDLVPKNYKKLGRLEDGKV